MVSKNIVLIDYTLEGHHLAFLRSFSKILLHQGHRVICLAPEVEKIQTWIENEHNGKALFWGHEYHFEKR